MKTKHKGGGKKKILSAVIVFFLLAFCIAVPLVILGSPGVKESSSIGIIGGADGPTAVFIAGKPGGKLVLLCLLPLIALGVVLVVVVVKATRRKKKK